MLKINQIKALKIILLFALINSSVFIVMHSSGIIRLLIILLMNISGILLIVYFFKITKKKFDTNLYFKIMFILLISWSLFTIFHSFSLNSKNLISLFGHYLMGWAWLTPLAVVFGFKIKNWLLLFDFISKLLFLGALVGLGIFLYPKYASGILEWMAFLPILLLTSFYQKRKTQRIVVLSLISYLLLTFVASQRANILFLGLLLIFFLVEYYRQSEIKKYKKFLLSLFMLLISVVIAIQINDYITKISQNKELTTDTRTFLAEEMFADMTNIEEIIGRGALGTYYSPYFANWNKYHKYADSPIRVINEVGYLQMILKGGYIMIILYLLILIPASYLGIFKSKNIIARMSGYYILAYLILWLVSYYPIYSDEYLLLWMAAGTAMSKSVRKVKNSDILIKRKGRLQFAK